MKTSIKHIKPTQTCGEPVLATVTAAAQGEATQVHIQGMERALPVAAHASHVPALHPGDAVMVLPTDAGVIVALRLRAPGERPQQGFSVNTDGSLSVEGAGTIRISTAGAAIELRQDGRLCVDGKEIYAIADGLHRVQGARIELN